jgi:hypothetical protein
MRLISAQAERQLHLFLEVTSTVPFLTTATSNAGEVMKMVSWGLGMIMTPNKVAKYLHRLPRR